MKAPGYRHAHGRVLRSAHLDSVEVEGSCAGGAGQPLAAFARKTASGVETGGAALASAYGLICA